MTKPIIMSRTSKVERSKLCSDTKASMVQLHNTNLFYRSCNIPRVEVALDFIGMTPTDNVSSAPFFIFPIEIRNSRSPRGSNNPDAMLQL
jgi:hypothetical protein